MELICGDCHHPQGVGKNYCGCDPAVVSSERQIVAVTAQCTFGKPTVDQTVI